MSASTRGGSTVAAGHDGEDLELVDLVDRLIEGGLHVHGGDVVLPR